MRGPALSSSCASADVLIEGGAELEIGWLPPLLQNARNPKIEVGKPGRVHGSQGNSLDGMCLRNVTRAAGDVHALGNPHFMIDPIIAKAVAQHIAQRFRRGRSSECRRSTRRTTRKFEATINAKLAGVGRGAAAVQRPKPLSPITIPGPISRTASAFSIDIFLEPKPGIPPSPSHLAEVIAQMKAEHIKAIIVEPFHNRKIAEKVAQFHRREGGRFRAIPGRAAGTRTAT